MKLTHYLHYVMLNVGGGQRVPRTDIADEAVDYLAPLLRDEGPHRAGLPELPLDLVVHHEGPALYVRIVDANATVAAFAVVPRSRGSVGINLWRRLHESGLDRFATDAATLPPEAPWTALALSRDLRQRPPRVVHGIIALTKSAAWAWLDRDALDA